MAAISGQAAIAVKRIDRVSAGLRRILQGVQIGAPSAARLAVVAGVVSFAWLFHRSYVSGLSTVYAFMGMHYRPWEGAIGTLPWVLALLPAAWLPVGLRRPSHLVLWILFLTVYVPSLFVPFYARTAPDVETLRFMLALAVSFTFLCLTSRLPLLSLPRLGWPEQLFWPGFVGAWLALNGMVLVVFGPHMRLVSLANVYVQRALADTIARGSFVNYATGWLGYAMNPFLIAWGLATRRRAAVALGIAGQLLIYMTGGDKFFVLVCPALLLLWPAVRSRRPAGAMVVWAACAGVAIASVLVVSLGALRFVGHVIMLRTLSLPGLLSAQYLDFFTRHPHTLLSHVKGVSAFVRYPYDLNVSFMIGEYYSGAATLNANAHFWVADGVAGFGVPGVFLVTPAAALLLWVLDSAPRPRHRRLVMMASIGQGAHLANASMFSSFLGGGIWLTLLLAWLLPDRAAPAPGPGPASPETVDLRDGTR